VSIRAHTDAKLTQAQLEKLASLLADKRHELTAKLEILNRQITMKEDCSLTDAAEAASLREEIARASATVVAEPVDAEGVGRFGILRDPIGGMIGVIKPASA